MNRHPCGNSSCEDNDGGCMNNMPCENQTEPKLNLYFDIGKEFLEGLTRGLGLHRYTPYGSCVQDAVLRAEREAIRRSIFGDAYQPTAYDFEEYKKARLERDMKGDIEIKLNQIKTPKLQLSKEFLEYLRGEDKNEDT